MSWSGSFRALQMAVNGPHDIRRATRGLAHFAIARISFGRVCMDAETIHLRG